jgi:lysophospholipase L1-like esterase
MAPDDMPAGGYVGDYAAFWAIWLALVVGVVLFFRLTRGRGGRGRLVFGNLMVLLALLWSAVVAGETYLRYVYDATDSWGIMLTNHAWFRRHVLHARGFRDVERPLEKPPGVVRVACVGDSFTEGWGVPDVADCWPQRVGAALEARFPGRFEVLNRARSGLTTKQELAFIEQAQPIEQWDRIVIGYCLNDADDLLPEDRWFGRDRMERVPVLAPTTSYLADFLWFRLRISKDPRVKAYFENQKEAYEDPKIWAQQREQFRRLAAFCAAASVRLDVVVMPAYHALGDDYSFAACHDRVVEAWREFGVEAIDLKDAYHGIPAKDLVASRYDAHPNARAHEVIARHVLERAFGVQ